MAGLAVAGGPYPQLGRRLAARDLEQVGHFSPAGTDQFGQPLTQPIVADRPKHGNGDPNGSQIHRQIGGPARQVALLALLNYRQGSLTRKAGHRSHTVLVDYQVAHHHDASPGKSFDNRPCTVNVAEHLPSSGRSIRICLAAIFASDASNKRVATCPTKEN